MVEFGRTWPELAELGPIVTKLGGNLPKLVNIWPTSTRFGPTLAGAWPKNRPEFGQISASGAASGQLLRSFRKPPEHADSFPRRVARNFSLKPPAMTGPCRAAKRCNPGRPSWRPICRRKTSRGSHPAGAGTPGFQTDVFSLRSYPAALSSAAASRIRSPHRGDPMCLL